MCSTIPLLLLMVIITAASIETSGIQLRRKYAEDAPFLMSRQTRPKFPSSFAPIPGNLFWGPKYSSRDSNTKPATIRLKPPMNSRPESSNSHGIVLTNNNIRAVSHRYRNGKPITSGGEAGLTSSKSKWSNRINMKPSSTGTIKQQEIVKMKPVHEEGSLMKVPVYINSFPEFTQQESSKLKDSRPVNDYEPLGDYARF